MPKPPSRTGYGQLIAIAIGFTLGIVIGWLLTIAIPNASVRASIDTWFKALGGIFVRLIRIIIPVLIFFTIAATTASIADARKLGIILLWMLILYIGTSILAATWGVLAGLLFQPGVGVGLKPSEGYKPQTPPSGVEILLNFFQQDFSSLLTVGGSMPMIIFAIIIGVSTLLLGAEGIKVANLLSLGSRLSIAFVRVIMYYAPIAIFGYGVWLMSEYGPKMLGAYAKFLVAQYSFALMHFFAIYSLLVWLGGLSPIKYFKVQFTPFLVAFATRSSAATLLYSMEAARKMGVPEYVFNITLPIGVAVNMDGTALYQALSAMFVAQLFNIPLQPYQLGHIIMVAVIGSVATVAIPGGGTIMLAYVLATVGLPLEGIAIMMVIDLIADAIRTAINVSGDNACTVLLTRIIEGKLNPQI
jgi:Na+/H+-dicarboxylate symporter